MERREYWEILTKYSLLNTNITSIAFSCLLMLTFSQCVSVSSMETARVTEHKKFGVLVGTGVPRYAYRTEDEEVRVVGSVSEVGGRYGIVEQVDLGATFRIIGASSLDIKYQFLGDQSSVFAGAAGTELGVFFISQDVRDGNTFEASIPLFFSYHPSENFAIYMNPKFVYRKYGSLEATNFWGGTTGFRFGQSLACFVEYGYLWNGSSDWSNQTQLNFGIARDIR